MANVLPPEHKRIASAVLRARFILMFSIVVALGAVVGMLSLAPTIISVRTARQGVQNEIAAMVRATSGDAAIAAKTQSVLLALVPLTATSSPSEVLATALDLRPNGVSITNITYTKGRFTFVGSARQREAVNDFKDALDGEPLFTEVSIPVSALVGAGGGNFTMTLGGKF